MCSLEDVAIWTSCQLTVCVECREDMKDSCSSFSTSREYSWSCVHIPAISWVGMCRVGAVAPSCMPS